MATEISILTNLDVPEAVFLQVLDLLADYHPDAAASGLLIPDDEHAVEPPC